MKKNKHITININDNEYSKLNELALKSDRSITNYCYLIIVKHLKEERKRDI